MEQEMNAIEVSTSTIDQLWRKGWTIIERVLDVNGVAVLGQVLDDARRDPHELEALFALSKEEFAAKDPVAQGNEKYKQVLEAYRELRRIYPELDAIITSTSLGNLARSLLGVDHVFLWADSFLLKPPQSRGGRPTPWHQDSPLIPFDRRDCLNLWIAMGDIGPEDGAIEVVPGSHRLGSLGVQDFINDVDFHCLLKGEEDLELIEPVVTVSLSAGDAVAFLPMTLHRAAVNRSNRERRAYQTWWIGSEVCYTGMPNMKTDGLGLQPGMPLSHERFPMVS